MADDEDKVDELPVGADGDAGGDAGPGDAPGDVGPGDIDVEPPQHDPADVRPEDLGPGAAPGDVAPGDVRPGAAPGDVAPGAAPGDARPGAAPGDVAPPDQDFPDEVIEPFPAGPEGDQERRQAIEDILKAEGVNPDAIPGIVKQLMDKLVEPGGAAPAGPPDGPQLDDNPHPVPEQFKPGEPPEPPEPDPPIEHEGVDDPRPIDPMEYPIDPIEAVDRAADREHRPHRHV